MRARLSEPPILFDPIDQATSLLGLAQNSGRPNSQCRIRETRLHVFDKRRRGNASQGDIAELNSYDRRSFMEAVIQNYETTRASASTGDKHPER